MVACEPTDKRRTNKKTKHCAIVTSSVMTVLIFKSEHILRLKLNDVSIGN